MTTIKDRFQSSRMIGHVFFDSWIAMLCLGALSSQLALPILAVGFWPVVLAVIAIQAIAPEQIHNLVVDEENI